MESYQLSARELPLHSEYDVIVAGGGPAGCTAAAAAAREGAKTLLIEATGSLGGMGTSGLVPAWCPFSDQEKMVYRGMAQRVFNESKASSPHVDPDAMDWVPVNAEALKRIYDNLLAEFGVDVLFQTMLSGVETDGNGAVKALIVTNKRGLSAYAAKVYIDATGDADLTVWAGGDFAFGENGVPMPSTHCFVLSNVDMYAYLYHPRYGLTRGGFLSGNPNSFTHLLPADPRYPDITDSHLCTNIVGPGTVGFNAGHLFDVDATDPVSVSKSMALGRRMAAQFRDAFASYFPEAFGNAFLVSTAPVMGIRESRRIVGDYTLTVEDYLSKATFPDEICRNSYYLDVHYTKEELEQKKLGNIDDDARSARYAAGESHGIPYRCLLPRKLRNVLVAGRSISCDKRIQGSVRVMPVCLCMGEAAGIAASLSLRVPGYNVHQVDTDRLRARLLEEGAYIL